MNDPIIRIAFHNTFLREEHKDSNTLVLDELGLEHGKCRADIAVINGHMDGYEIKSDVDTLNRLNRQINSYDAIFDHSSIVVAESHINNVIITIPHHWGVILAAKSSFGLPEFNIIRHPEQNRSINDNAVAQLLWRKEAQEILYNLGIRDTRLKQNRSILYNYIEKMLDSSELRFIVREHLKKRQGWKYPALPMSNDD